MNTENNCIVQILIISYSQTLLFSLPKKWDYASLYICSSSIFKKTGFKNSFNKSCTIANVFCNGYDNIEMKWVAVIEFSQAYYLLPWKCFFQDNFQKILPVFWHFDDKH